MHRVLASFLAAATFAAAHTTSEPTASGSVPDISKIPQCALQCVIQSAGTTSCALADAYCQCTTGAADIAKALFPCLCQSTCTPEELHTTHDVTADICVAALKAKGEEFQSTTSSMDMCKAYTAGAAPAPAPAPAPSSGGTPAMSPTYSGMSDAIPKTNLTPSVAPKPYEPNMTNTSTGATPGKPGIEQSTGGAAGVEVGMRMVGTAVIVGLVGAALAAL